MQVQEESISEDIFDSYKINDGSTYYRYGGFHIFLPYKDKTFYIIPDIVKHWFVHLCMRSIRNLGLVWNPPDELHDSSVKNKCLESQYQRFGITKIRNKSCGTAFMMHICLESGIDIRSAHL